MKPSTLVIALVLAALSGALGMILYGELTGSRDEPEAVTKPEQAATDDQNEAPEIAPDIPAREGGFKDDFAALHARREGVVKLASGVQYEVIESGDGDQPKASDTVLVRYEASLPDGRIFDSTEEDGVPVALPIEKIAAPGLREALLLMREGDHWLVVIPPSEGFANFGNNRLRRRDLIYDIRLLSVEPPSDADDG
jgi:FKBP-type peptidyl-prolyl cis-trans isomerase FklB